MEDNVKIIFNGKELKDLRNEKVYVELDNSVERTTVDIEDLKLKEFSFNKDGLSGTLVTIEMTPEVENWFENMKAKALLETWRKLKESTNEK